jgi:hypothetical protein
MPEQPYPTLALEQMTDRIKELEVLRVEHLREMDKLEREQRYYERLRFEQAPRGSYRHRRHDGTDIQVEAAVLETDGEAKYIKYQIPWGHARRGEEDAFLRWLRTPEELARFRFEEKKRRF